MSYGKSIYSYWNNLLRIASCDTVAGKEREMKDGYPEDRDLAVIKEWQLDRWHKELDPFELMDFIESITWTSDWCIKRKGKKIVYFEFHTAGWSGNEEIIEVLKNTMFWTLYWQKTLRGGHYYFKVKKLK